MGNFVIYFEQVKLFVYKALAFIVDLCFTFLTSSLILSSYLTSSLFSHCLSLLLLPSHTSSLFISLPLVSFPSGYQDGGEEFPQISADLDDIASDDEEIAHIEIQRDGTGFGFSIRGGAEYNSPLYVLRIAEGGAAERDNRLQVSGF